MGRNELSQLVRLIPYVIAIENQLLSTAKRTSKNPPHLPIPFSIDLLSRFCKAKRKLGVVTDKPSFGFTWQLPKAEEGKYQWEEITADDDLPFDI